MGRLGKDKSPRAALSLIIGMVLAACAGGGRDGRYVGALGVESGRCGDGSASDLQGSLVIHGAGVMFVPSEGVLVLAGTIDDAGHIAASLAMPGVDRKGFAMVFEGRLAGREVIGRYATPACRASVRLTRAD